MVAPMTGSGVLDVIGPWPPLAEEGRRRASLRGEPGAVAVPAGDGGIGRGSDWARESSQRARRVPCGKAFFHNLFRRRKTQSLTSPGEGGLGRAGANMNSVP